MQYFIGINAPKSYEKIILSIRDSLGIKTTQPHITLIPPNILPNDDIFISSLISCCSRIDKFNIEINGIGQFDERVIFLKINSNKISEARNKVYHDLGLEMEKREFVPHMTIIKSRAKNSKYVIKSNIEKIKKIIDQKIPLSNKYTVKSFVVYQQKKDMAPFLPYMEIPLL